MQLVNRRVTYRLYPRPAQEEKLQQMFVAHQRLYNVALEQRVDYWRGRRASISFAAQCKELTDLRAAFPEYAAINAQSCQVTLKRLDLAFQAFYRRVKKGETPGFPRFKSLHHFRGWGYKTHGDGWKLLAGEGMKHGSLQLSGVGKIRMRGKARTAGAPKTLDVQFRAGKWYASVVVACSPSRNHGLEAKGFDWGLENFLTFHDGAKVANPRFARQVAKEIAHLQRQVAKKKRGGQNRRKAVGRLAKKHEKVANKRSDFLHQVSARLVAEASILATEELAVEEMTKSSRGSGKRRKAGLNRGILDGAPAAFIGMARYKAEEAGIVLVEVPTRLVKPSQTCPACGRQRKKSLAERVHSCECGCVMSRDQAAALVCLHYALRAGNQPSGEDAPFGAPMNHETVSITA